jgi:regulator of ribonuclease activity A
MNFSVPDICDDFRSEIEVLEPLFTAYGGRRKFCGETVTIKCFEDNSLVKETLGSAGNGRVLVVDGGASMRCALLGDMLAAMAAENGWQGILINGCVRDVEILRTIDIGVIALNCHPQKSQKNNEGQLNVMLRFADVSFESGQYLYADENGIILAKKELNLP